MPVSNLLKTLNDATDASLYRNTSEQEREELLAACAKFQASIETPIQTTFRTTLAPYFAIALRLGVDMKLFDPVSKGEKKVTIDQLASRANAEPALVRRVMRLLCRMDLFNEVGKDTFERLPLADSYVSGSIFVDAVVHITIAFETSSKFARYFEEKGYKCPDDAYHSPFQCSEKTELLYWDWMATKPKIQQAFHKVMAFSRGGRSAEWFNFFPVAEKLHVNSPDEALLVDIGGGEGQVLKAFKEQFPAVSGRLILQDLAVVVESMKDLPAGIEAIPHDFFAPQPIKGAKAYFLRAILHDWPDKQSREILGHIRDAMSKDSILLINEYMVPETNVSLRAAQMDFLMMDLGALERTESQFRTLLDSAGLELVRVWKPETEDGSTKSLFEAVLKKE